MKNRRWYCAQSGVGCLHSDIESLIGELREIDKNGLNADSFELQIRDIPPSLYTFLIDCCPLLRRVSHK